MADAQYGQEITNLLCGVCGLDVELETIQFHGCFNGAQDAQISLEGNIINFENDQNLPNLQQNQQPKKAIKKSSDNIDLDHDGNATQSNNNLINLVEMVRESPCLWDPRVPLKRRSPSIISSKWLEISNNFPGWSPEMTKQKFTSLKGSFNRRKKVPASGSGGLNQKPWFLEPYLSFIDDQLADTSRSTFSNVRDPVEEIDSSHEYHSCNGGSSDEEISKKPHYGFPLKKPGGKRQKRDNALESAILELTKNSIKAKKPKKESSALEQWSTWLAKEIELFPDGERLQIQSQITNFIAEKRQGEQS
ncbi:uncharacterized protein LOC127278990 [Leptopilina boulardi]|uniref:uncharacterized protein LOC127278990 n=1 Tax=Leptopilina boulardi TaxID=63433 RepID=UPI0021F6960F|nr:uncharacterized protein LOC127278990 [Leptopilina boulardi]